MVHIACQHLLRMLRINMAVLDKLVHRGIWRRIKIASEYDRNWSFRIVKSTYDCQQHLTLPQLNLQKNIRTLTAMEQKNTLYTKS